MKNKIFYPAIFTECEEGYTVQFPDLPECITEGKTLEEAHEMAFESLGLVLSYKEDMQEDIPAPSTPFNIELEDKQIVMLVEFDMKAYKRKVGSRSVKKTLSIPQWLNEEAEKANINFSAVLQAALKERLQL